MNILYADYQMYGKEDIEAALRALGHTVTETDLPLLYEQDVPSLEQELDTLINSAGFDLVFTSNFHPELARVCDKNKVKYVSWTYDSPLVALYDRTVLSPYCYTFIFDSAEVAALKQRGATQVWYMPLAVNADRVGKINISEEDRKSFSADVSLVASLYNESHNLYDRLSTKLDEYIVGFLEGVMHAQANLFGGNLIDDVLTAHPELVQVMKQTMPYPLAEGSLADESYVYANYFLCRKVANIQRLKLIDEIAKRFDLKVYTRGDLSALPHVKCMGTVDYKTDMNKVFKLSKINLNITLPSIHTGIPLRALDIMGAGGFLLSNWQQDYEGLFEVGEDFAAYTSLDDLLFLIDYYLTHEEERAAVAQQGQKKVAEAFNFEAMLAQILEIAEA